ncbi:hypothetical protein BG015_004039 [Linnemannia schmuckeri]|uniref:VWFA domain-containing protein n=1 Tax=Linnemannia schmuckeri TaxID=64567 RepID=A0A9P5RE28_9FUNG|nr:hypothetical protein BG015_004039 [Linnemannia schmuckeri]
MPRQDYSLPQIVPLPKLARLKAPVVPTAKSAEKQEQESNNKDTVMVVGNNQDSGNDTDEEYDMLDDDEEILKLMEPLENNLSGLNLKDSTKSATATATADATCTSSSAFVDMLLDATQALPDPNMTATQNGAPTFASTENACLDFFFEVLKGTDAETITRLARTAWTQSPLDTLRLIFQLRSIIHGKGDRKEFYHCMDFLRQEHPRTLLFNLRYIPDHGYWKDLLNWLVFEVRQDRTDFVLTTRPAKPKKAPRPAVAPKPRRHRIQNAGKVQAEIKAPTTKVTKTPEDRKRAIEAAEERNRQNSVKARVERLAKIEARLGCARAAFKENDFYRVLHLEVARLFANALIRDKARLQKGQSVSLAAKWCPSLNQFHDNQTLIASTIAQILYPTKLTGEDQATYVNRVRQLYRQEYYVPLRKATPVLETFMTSDRWNEIVYNRVPAVAMKNNKERFEAHDKERFTEYLGSVSKGETTIASQALLPHQLVTEATNLLSVDREELRVKTVEAQWKSYVDRLAASGTMDSTIAICDVSGSMSGEPMEVAIALSLLLAQLSRPPFNRVVLTFSADPSIHIIKEGSLINQVQSLRNMDWGYNTDLQKAFGLILERAVASKLAKEDMVKTMFIFSDMEFDQAVQGVSTPTELFTNYSVVKRNFEAAGYELPQIVFWNLAGSSRGNKPAKANQKGVAMVSGFSGMLMKLFLDGSDLAAGIDPVLVMRKAIDDKFFARLTVHD